MSYGQVELNPGSGGSKVAADLVTESGQLREFQRIKLVWGPEGTITPVDVGAGALPIQDGGNSITIDGAVTISGNSRVQGVTAHDAAITEDPVLEGGYASAAAPAGVSADGDKVRAWRLRNGSAAVVLTAAGALIGGDATNGLDVDVTRVQGTVTVDTELPPAGPLNDSFVNPTAPAVGAFGMVWNGSVWDRARGDASNGVDVDVTRVPAPLNVVGAGTQATALRVTLATDSPGAAPLYVEDDVAPANPTGDATMVRARTTPAVEPSTSGDWVALTGPVEGGVWTALLGDGVPAERIGGTSANGLDVDVTRIAAGTNYIGRVRLTDGTFDSTVRDLAGGAALNVAINDGSGNQVLGGNGAAAAALRVTLASDSTGVVAATVTQATASNLNAEVQGDAAADAPVSGNPLYMGARASTATPTAVSADGDAQALWIDRRGAQKMVMVEDNGDSCMDAVNNSLQVSLVAIASSTNMTVNGTAATDAAVSGNPVYVGQRASIASPTAVSGDGDMVPFWGDRRGALVSVPRPSDHGSLGSYALSMATGTMAAGLAANSEIAQFRWTSGTNLCRIKRIKWDGGGSIIGFAAGFTRFAAFIARSWSAAGTGGGTATISGNNNKRRTSMGTTTLGEFRMATTAALGAGTKTLDAQAIGAQMYGTPATAGSPVCPAGIIYEAGNEDMYPILLAQNEGIVIVATVPATGTWTAGVTIEWDEVTGY